MHNRKGDVNVISVLILLMFVFAIGNGMYYWFTRMQSESQQITTQYNEDVIDNLNTQVKIIDAKYNTLGEIKADIPATLKITLQNIGEKKLKITNNTQFIIQNQDETICLSNISGSCTNSNDEIYASKSNGDSTSSILYSTDGVTWSLVDNNIGTPYLKSAKSFENRLYFGGIHNSSTNTYGAQIFRSKNLENWLVSTGFNYSDYVYDLEIFNNTLYAAIGNTGSNQGAIYKQEANLTWNKVYDAGEREARALEVYDNKLYAGIAGDSKLVSSVDGISWTTVSSSMNDIASLYSNGTDLFIGSTTGEIYHSEDGSTFGSPVKSTGQNSVNAFETFGEYIYAGSNLTNNAHIYRSSNGNSWDLIYSSNNNSVNSFALFNNKLLAVMSSDNGGAIISTTTGDSWSEVNISDGRGFTTIENHTYCSNKKVSCIQGCNSTVDPGEIRIIELEIAGTDCALNNYGTGTAFSFKIIFSSSAEVTGKFKKDIIEETNTVTPCSNTYPFCTGTCTTGSCKNDLLSNTCVCAPINACETVDLNNFMCSVGNCETGTCVTSVSGDNCECSN